MFQVCMRKLSNKLRDYLHYHIFLNRLYSKALLEEFREKRKEKTEK